MSNTLCTLGSSPNVKASSLPWTKSARATSISREAWGSTGGSHILLCLNFFGPVLMGAKWECMPLVEVEDPVRVEAEDGDGEESTSISWTGRFLMCDESKPDTEAAAVDV